MVSGDSKVEEKEKSMVGNLKVWNTRTKIVAVVIGVLRSLL